MQASAQIGVAFLAVFAAVARHCGIDGHTLTDRQRIVETVSRVFTDLCYDTRELVPHHQWRLDTRFADASVSVPVKV